MSKMIMMATIWHLLLLAAFFEISGAAVRPVVSFSPNWSPIFPGESVTLSCNVAPTAQGNLGYSWYRNGYWIHGDQQSLVIQSARETDRGDYQCQAGASERSDPVTLDIKSDLLILQAPPAVHEGDSLCLRCHSQPGYDTRNTVFYMGDKIIQTPDTVLLMGKVNATASGTYGCIKDIYYNYVYRTTHAKHVIRVSELFTVSQLNVSPDQVTEGDHVTITCDTELSPHRETTELQFAFYRNGHNVQGFSLSNQYGVPSAQLEDSGNYTCEVQTPTGSVRKRSNMAHIHIQGAAVRPVVSFSPNWTPIFPGESVTLSCNVAPTAQGNLGYSWYRDGQRIPGDQQTLVIQAARETDSGDYQCQAGASERSDPVTLDIKSDLLILQAPPAVHEGDSLSLRCHSRPGYDTRNTVFYMGDKIIQTPDTVLQIGKVNATASGTYGCMKDIYYNSEFQTTHAELVIRVAELFTVPQIQVRPNQVTEGDHMTITCDTKLSPRRATTELQFAFYRNGQNVQGFGLSNRYGVPSAQLEDSGNYTCEVQTPTGSVRKRSSMAHIHIQELFTYPQIQVSPDQVRGDHMTITCDTELSPHRETTELQFAFYKNGHNVQGFSLSNQYGVPSAQLEDSGNYTCEVQTPTGSVRKRSNMVHIHIQAVKITDFPYTKKITIY